MAQRKRTLAVSPRPEQAAKVEALIQELGSPKGTARQSARRKLVRAGSAAVPALIRALGDPRKQARWEVAKTLGEIADPISASALVRSLQDRDGDVRWLAAAALSAIGREALEPLFTALLDHPDSDLLRQGAHHVCHDLVHRTGDEEAALVLAALNESDTELHLPPAAYAALQALRRSRMPSPESNSKARAK